MQPFFSEFCWVAIALTAVLSVQNTSATPLKQVKRQVVQDSYDFVIVGGGTAGLTLAARLTASGTQSVLVLEAGQPPTAVIGYSAPGYNLLLGGTIIDWYFITPPQGTLYNRTLPYHRGRCLGGSSSTNGLAYVRPSVSIFNQWETLGNDGWSWDDVYPYFIKSTTFNPPTDDAPYQVWDPHAYSDGPVQVSFSGYKVSSSIGFVEASATLGIPIVELNNGTSSGVTLGTSTIDSDFQRSGSYDSYYMQAKGRSNLNVLNLAPVHQINLQKEGNSLKAMGIVFEDQMTGALLNVTANKEVIMCAGAFQTPQLLMLSGIGPEKVLHDNGISPYLINENVGQNLQDHAQSGIQVRVQANASLQGLLSNYGLLYDQEEEYWDQRTGLLTTPSGITNVFQQLTMAELQSLNATDLISQNRTNQRHIEYLYTGSFYPGFPSPEYTPSPNESYISINIGALATLSRGNVSIQSANPYDSPVLQLNACLSFPPTITLLTDVWQYLENQVDQKLSILALKNARKMLAHPALQQFAIGSDNGEVSPGPTVQSDEDILAYIRNTSIPNWHACGTTAMLPSDQGGVVDNRLHVYGVESLRIVDSGIFPIVPDANILSSVYMVAEKAADMIAQDYDFAL